ncbi:MAG: hypothetical protein IKC64_02430 [Clostridia bacterium]|nr:hypothetical protein [Clostridia bacterium]
MGKDTVSKGGDNNGLHAHEYEMTVVPPTCTEKGYKLYKCRYCDYEYREDYVPARHTFSEWELVSLPSCDKPGIEERKCIHCGETQTRETEKSEHVYGEWIEKTRPSCTEDGVEERQCRLCGKIESRTVSATGHKFTTWKTDGNIKSRYCKNCGLTEEIDLEQERLEKERKERQRQLEQQERLRQQRLEEERAQRREKTKAFFKVAFAYLFLILGVGATLFAFWSFSSNSTKWPEIKKMLFSFDALRVISFFVGAVMLGLSVLLMGKRSCSSRRQKMLSVFCAISSTLAGIVIFSGIIWIFSTILNGSTFYANAVIVLVSGIGLWIWCALAYNDGEMRKSACVTSIVFGAISIFFGCELLSTNAKLIIISGLIMSCIGIAFSLVGMLVNKLKDYGQTGCVTALIVGVLMIGLGVLGFIRFTINGSVDGITYATIVGFIGIAYSLFGTWLSGEGETLRCVGCIVNVIIGALIAIAGACFILYVPQFMQMGIKFGVTGIALTMAGTFIDTDQDVSEFCSVALIALGGVIAGICVYVPIGIIERAIAIFILGAVIPFVVGISRDEYDDISHTWGGIVFTIVVVLLVIRVVWSCMG